MPSELKALSDLENLVLKRRWLLRELREFKGKYGVSSMVFCEKWVKGLISEPEDPVTHEDFII